MNKGILVLMVLVIPLAAQAENLSIRPYGRIGYTLAPPSQDDLDYDTDYVDTYNNLNYGAGIQVMYDLADSAPNLKVGGDLGFLSIFSAIYELGESSDDSYSRWDEWEGSAYLLALAEYEFVENFFIQGGPGLYYRFWESNYEHTSDGSVSDWEDYTGTAASLGLSLSGGTDLPIAESVGFFAVARFDFIFAYGIEVPFSVLAGLSINL